VIYVAVLALAVALTVAATTGGVLRSMVRQQARERELLLDRIMHLAGRTWTPPPELPPVPEQQLEEMLDPYQLPDPY
jgi:hypothetical protein